MRAAHERLTPRPGVRERIGAYRGAGGRELRFREVAPAAAAPRRRLLYLHGIESHGAWFLPVARRLARHGVATWLLDRRGSGLNRAPAPGDAESARALLEDVSRFRDHARDPELGIAGLSWGGKLALAAAVDRPRRVRGVALIAPGLVPRVRLGPGACLALALGLATCGRRAVRLPLTAAMFTDDPRWRAFIDADPLRLRSVAARTLLAGARLDRRIVRGLPRLDVDVVLLVSDRDAIVDSDAAERLLSRLPDGRLRVRRFPRAAHALQFERPSAVAAEIARLLETGTAPC